MSTSNNLDEKLLLNYITRNLNAWGILYIDEDTLKQAKRNDPNCIQHMIRLLFDLVMLHIFNFDNLTNDLCIDFQQEQEEIIEIVLAHLFEIDCPMIIVGEEGEGQKTVGFDFASSRHILITCGWVMAVSDFFNKVGEKLIKKKMTKLYKPQPLNLGPRSKKYMEGLTTINLHPDSSQFQRISFLSKQLKSRKYSVECLIEKRKKIIKKLKNELQCVSSEITIEDLFNSGDREQVEKRESQLREIIVFEKQNMSYRKYWWIWLDQKIISLEYSDLAAKYEDFSKLQCQHSITFNITTDFNYPRMYVQTCQKYQTQIDALMERIKTMGLKVKKCYKEIDRELTEQIGRVRERAIEEQTTRPSFIGMQIKKYMSKETSEVVGDGKQQKKMAEKSNRKLRQSIRAFVAQLQGILMI